MARQKSEDSIVSEGRRKASPTERARGEKGVPVNQEMGQLGLPLVTAASPRGSVRRRDGDRSSSTPPTTVPKTSVKTSKTPSATLESVIEHLDEAFDRVERNKGAPGPDGRRVQDVREDWTRIRRSLAHSLRSGSYTPGLIRRVQIPKPTGGVRQLGIPNVVDRVVQESIRRCVQSTFEPGFHGSSHGFRPKRSCHTALAEAQEHVEAGRHWVVDLDLSKFFDRVNHQRLMARVSRKVQDRPLLVLIGQLLKASVVLSSGVHVRTDEGVPQGGPLSPILSNIVLDELDWEMERRGYRFVRYADDVAIFVGSERAGTRVMQSVTRFIEGRMRLKVNADKSSVRRPNQGNFLGFRLAIEPDGSTKVCLSERTLKRASARIRELTPRNWGGAFTACIARLNRYLTGWFGYFGVCSIDCRAKLRQLDARTRRRLRALKLKQWKRKRTIIRHLNRMKFSKKVARNVYKGQRSWWALSRDGVVSHRLNNQWFIEQGHYALERRLVERKLTKVAPAQQSFGWG